MQRKGAVDTNTDETGNSNSETYERTQSSATTVLATLEFVGGAPTRKLGEIIDHLGRPKSTVLRLLDTLVKSGFVRRVGPGEYGTTLKLWRLGCQALHELETGTLIHPALKRMSFETGESGLYAVYDNGYSVFVEKIDSIQPVAASVAIGARAPAYATATGKSLLAHQSAEEIERVLKSVVSHTARTITDYDALQAELATVRNEGLALSYGEWREEIAGAASPVFNRYGEVVGAVGISCPLSRVEERLTELGKTVMATASELSLRFGATERS